MYASASLIAHGHVDYELIFGFDPLQFLCITMPPWPGDSEATVVEGPWKPNAPEG